jgi:hypothetical protein
MSKLTVAQIVHFGNALALCEEASLTWAEAKPYLIYYVRTTGHTFNPINNLPEVADVNKWADALTLDEIIALVRLLYDSKCIIEPPFCLNLPVLLEEGTRVLQEWALQTGCCEPPLVLSRLSPRANPEILRLYEYISGNIVIAANVFGLNQEIKILAQRFVRAEIVDNILNLFGRDGSHHSYGGPLIFPPKPTRDFCELFNKFMK